MNFPLIHSTIRPAADGESVGAPKARRWLHFMLAGGLGLLLAATASAADVGQTFATPEKAVASLAAAANGRDRDGLRALFGLATDELVAVDRVQASNDLTGFTAALNQTNHLAREGDDRYTLEVGRNQWPFPIPIVRQNGRWFFDADAGKETLLDRRIGQNELRTLQTVRAYVEAQRDYARQDRDGDEVLQYAQKIVSTPGRHDGLYWPTEGDDDLSPLGPLVAQAQGEGYSVKAREADADPEPYHGYYFKVLTRQGPNAPGGKYNYIINGNMIGGFALVAYPAQYGESGIMTFIVNQQGKVYQQDLGPKTARIAGKLKAYDPDSAWTLSKD